MRAIIGDLCFRGCSSAELLSNIIYTSFNDFLSEISEVSYICDDRAGKRAQSRKKDCTIHLRCDIIIMGGWAFLFFYRPRREEG